MWLNLYATRLVLKNLGVEDMGVYGVVGSIVSLFSVFTIGITYTVQRFITFELGKIKGDVNKVFCTSLNIIILISAFILVFLESVGIWFLFNCVNIPQVSMQAAFWVYQMSVLTCIVNLISIPYNALVIAHEKMDAYATISILHVILTCASAYCISFFESERLLIYALLMAIVSILIRIIYQIYCRYMFEESIFHFVIDRSTMKEMGSYAGVSTISEILYVLYSQGLVLVINLTIGVAINAVYSIALQLKNSILSFAYNIFKAVSPQITKTYANEDIETHLNLVYSTCKIQVYMLYFVLIPFLFQTEYIMRLWLGDIPPYMVVFAKISIFMCLTNAILEPIRTAVNATGRILMYSLIPNIFYFFSLFLTYLLIIWSQNPISLILSVVVVDLIAFVFHIYYAMDVTLLLFNELCMKVLIPVIVVAIGDIAICYTISFYMQETIISLLFFLFINAILLLMIIYFVGISKRERNLLNDLVKVMFKSHV